MLGNWVYDSERTKFPMKVVNIDTDSVYLDFDGNEGDVFDGKDSDICPIPLTEEMLLKNGFEKSEYYPNGKFYRYIYRENNRYFEVLNHVDAFEAYNYCGERPTFDIGSFYIKYVHQLQCLLNLCGIEIEFKI